MSHQTGQQYCDSERNRLEKKGFSDVTPRWFDLAMFNQSWKPLVPGVVGIVLALYSTDSPQVIFDAFTGWAKSLLGKNGMGTLVYVYDKPGIDQVDQVLKLGRGMMGYGQVVPYVYDLSSHQYWGWSPMQNITHTTHPPV